MLFVKNGMIHDGVHQEAFCGNILVEHGKIQAVEPSSVSLEIPEEARVIDAEGLHVYPGFVEAHGHIGLDGYGIGYEGMDYNEMNDIVCPQMRGIDGVKPMDPAFAKVLPVSVWDREAPMCWVVLLQPSRQWASVWMTWWCGMALP